MAGALRTYLVCITSGGAVLARLRLNSSWAPRNVDSVVSALPLRARTFEVPPGLVCVQLDRRLVPERPVTEAREGDVLAVTGLNYLAVAKTRLRLRYKATLIGRVEEGLERLVPSLNVVLEVCGGDPGQVR